MTDAVRRARAHPIRRARRVGAARSAGAILAAAALLGPAVALANDAGFKAAVPFSGGRTTDLRAGEPLEFLYKGETITKVCWSPAPIQHAACGHGIAAPAAAGTQQLTVTLKGGAVKHESLTIGAPATDLPSSKDAGSAGARVVEYRATCTTAAYDNYTHGQLRGTHSGVKLHAGDEAGAFYRAGKHAILAMPYRDGIARFFSDRCLVPVH
ncbi:MAG: hypothetical protein REI11_19165 [Patulibacter sp.]|nr:hypothetical protein [Patulibacter sp.]